MGSASRKRIACQYHAKVSESGWISQVSDMDTYWTSALFAYTLADSVANGKLQNDCTAMFSIQLHHDIILGN